MNEHREEIHDLSTPALPIACTLTSSDLARRAEEVRQELFAGVEERRMLDTGYAFRFPSEGDWSSRISDFITTERRCCSFFRMNLTFEPGLGPIWLTLTGPTGTKEFIEATFFTPDQDRPV